MLDPNGRGYMRPAYTDAPSLSGGAYANDSLDSTTHAHPQTQTQMPLPSSNPPQPPLLDRDLLPTGNRYGTNGTAQQTPPSDSLLHGYTEKLINGTAFNGGPDTSPGRGGAGRLLDVNDPVAMHLLVETALGDSMAYDVLSLGELERLKVELSQLTPRIESLRKRLAMESKIRDAAASLNRLYRQGTSTGSSNSPSSAGKRRSSSRSSNDDAPTRQHRESIIKMEDELSTANEKCDDISRELYALELRQQTVQTRLLTHTAGVLQMTHRGPTAKRNLDDFPHTSGDIVNGVNGNHGNNGRPDSPASIYTYENARDGERRADRDDFDERSLYRAPHEMCGFSFDGSSRSERGTGKDFSHLSERLEDLDARLRDALIQANVAGDPSPLEAEANAESEPATASLATVIRQIDMISRNLSAFATAHSNSSQQMSQLRQKSRQLEETVAQKDRQCEDLAKNRDRDLAVAQKRAEQLQLQLNSSIPPEMLPKIHHVNEQLYGLLVAAAAAGSKMQDTASPPSNDVSNAGTGIEYMESAVVEVSKTFQDQLAAAQGGKERGTAERERAEQVETVLTGLWTIIIASEEDERPRREAAGEDQKDLPNFDGSEPFSLTAFSAKIQWLIGHAAELKEQLQCKTTELAQMEQALEANRATTAERQNTLLELRAKLASHEDELGKVKSESAKQTAELEGELVRLTTEVTLAKAELDAAYGSRAERRAEADADARKELEDVRAREKELADELRDTLGEFEELTRAGVDAERERDKLEAIVDGMGARLEEAEAQLAEERVKWLAVKSPGEGGAAGETASIGTMRAEFKRMMRDQRAEGMKALRAEQDERKKLEAQLRQLRKDKEGPKKSGLSNLRSLD